MVLELERLKDQHDLHLFQVRKTASLFAYLPGHSVTDRPTLNGVITSVRRNKLLLTRKPFHSQPRRSRFIAQADRPTLGALQPSQGPEKPSHYWRDTQPFYAELLTYVKRIGGDRTAWKLADY